MSTKMSPSLAPVVLAAVAVLLTIPLVYAALRASDVVSGPGVNPATAPVSIHIAMFWRLAVAAFASGMVAPIAYLAACRALRRTLEVLSVLTVAVALITVVQGTLFP
jgi:hypothetical protein